MAYCGPNGIPLSTFLAWRPDDRHAAMAWQARESHRCRGCGTFAEDWDPECGGDRNAYKATFTECQGCIELERLRDAPELRDVRGVHLHLTKP
jgi:hypothetical protein